MYNTHESLIHPAHQISWMNSQKNRNYPIKLILLSKYFIALTVSDTKLNN
jgi:hypothetical protein